MNAQNRPAEQAANHDSSRRGECNLVAGDVTAFIKSLTPLTGRDSVVPSHHVSSCQRSPVIAGHAQP